MTENYSDYSLQTLLLAHPNAEIKIRLRDFNKRLVLRVILRNDDYDNYIPIRSFEITLRNDDLALCLCDEQGNLHPIGYDILFRKLDSLKQEDKNNV